MAVSMLTSTRDIYCTIELATAVYHIHLCEHRDTCSAQNLCTIFVCASQVSVCVCMRVCVCVCVCVRALPTSEPLPTKGWKELSETVDTGAHRQHCATEEEDWGWGQGQERMKPAGTCVEIGKGSSQYNSTLVTLHTPNYLHLAPGKSLEQNLREKCRGG